MSAVSAPATICRGSALRYASRSGASTQSFSTPASWSGNAAPPLPDDEAAQPARMQGSGEQRGAGADVGADDVRVLEPERVGEADDELAHRPRREQLIAALGMTESRQVDGHQMRVLGEPRPGRLEGEQALRPRAQQQGVIVPVLALGEADRQPVDGPELRLDGPVQPGAHPASVRRAGRARIRHWPVVARAAPQLGRRGAVRAAGRRSGRWAGRGRAGCAS